MAYLLTHLQGTAQASLRLGAMEWVGAEPHLCLGDPSLVALFPSTALQCPGGTQLQTGVPNFHNQLWNVLTGRVSGLCPGYGPGGLGNPGNCPQGTPV